jgi:hypothetical protein
MKVSRRSPISGKIHVLEIPVEEGLLGEFLDGAIDKPIQDIFPNLAAEEREFILTGITPEEWELHIKSKVD